MKTAEEVYKQITGCVMNHGDIKLAMIEFAKLHVRAALKRAYENRKMSWTNSNDEEVKLGLFIRNSYPDAKIY